jgi:hypothetical protein
VSRRVALAAVALLGPLAGCGGGSSDDVNVTIGEWTLDADPLVTDSGTISMAIDSTGELEHELVLVAKPDAGPLPTLPTGEVDLAAAPAVDRVDAFAPGHFEASFLRVLPGDYILLCNLVTDGVAHYAKGMAVDIEVSSTARDEPVTTSTAG